MVNSSMVSSMEVGLLDVFHLKRLWSRVMLNRAGLLQDQAHLDEWVLDKIVIFGLGLALEETFHYLYQTAPTFGEFEGWILAKNGGSINQKQIERINAAIAGTIHRESLQEAHLVEFSEPALSEEDLSFWEENGYVVVHDAVSRESCKVAEEAVWEFLAMSPDEPETWYQRSSDHGIMVQFFHHQALQSNRRSPRIHKAFAQLWGTVDLWTTVDRVSFNPPERPGWRFPGPRLHWDTSLDLPIPFGVQGLLYLTDTVATQGAFTCVPGFHRRIADWLKGLPPNADPRQADLESLGPVPIAGEAGDLIIWHQALPHGSGPNTACRPRIVQYVYMYPTDEEHRKHWK